MINPNNFDCVWAVMTRVCQPERQLLQWCMSSPQKISIANSQCLSTVVVQLLLVNHCGGGLIHTQKKSLIVLTKPFMSVSVIVFGSDTTICTQNACKYHLGFLCSVCYLELSSRPLYSSYFMQCKRIFIFGV